MRWVIGYLCLGLSAFLMLAVLSFHPQDTSLLVSSPNVISENIAGRTGVWASSYLVVVYGLPGAFLLSFGLLVVGLHVLAKSKLGKIWVKVLLFFIAAISLSVVFAMVDRGGDYRWGGLIGVTIRTTMEEVLPSAVVTGIFVILFLWAMIAALKFLQRLLFFVFGGIMEVFESPRRQAELNEAIAETSFDARVEAEVVSEAPVLSKEPDFLQRKGFADTEDANIDVPYWLKAPSASSALREEVAVACGVLEQPLREGDGGVSSLSDESVGVRGAGDSVFDEAVGKILPVAGSALASVDVQESVESEHGEACSEGGAGEPHEEDLFSYVDRPSGKKESISLRDDAPRQSTSSYRPPAASLLEVDLKERFGPEDEKEVRSVSQLIEMTFKSFKIDVRVVGYARGPAITRYEVAPPSGLKLRTITSLIDDLALNLGDAHIRIVTPIGERGLIGIEVPNRKRRHVLLREVVESAEFERNDAVLPLILGKNITGAILVDDLTEMPHLLIAGTTGSGKSVYVNTLLASLIFKKSYDDLRFILIDPKMVELELYNGLPHLLAPVINQPEVAIVVLEWVVREMERRYKMFSELGIRNIGEYLQRCPTEQGFEKLYYLVVVVDEFADLMLRIPKETERVISRLAAMARAVGIHLVVATQRPSVDVVTGIIKANFPSRVAFRVSSQTDSRTILDRGGAEKLLGKGDMLFLCPKNTDLVRLQAPYVSGKEIETLVYEMKRQKRAEYLLDVNDLMEEVENPSGAVDDYPRDPLFEEALRLAAETGEVSASFLQRRLRIGYNRASRIVDIMDGLHILGPSTGASKPRSVLITAIEVDAYLDTKE